MRPLDIFIVPGRFAISRGGPDAAAPPVDGRHRFVCVTRTDDEVSVVAPEEVTLEGFQRTDGWRCLKIAGPLAFGEIGILADLSAHLAAAGVSIVAISTFDTDYLLVSDSALARSVAALEAAGHRITAVAR
jgi:uncharacterized protein